MYVYIHIWLTSFNPYRGADIFVSLPVSFRYPSGVRVKLPCDSVSALTERLLPFRYPSGILPVSFRRAGKINISHLNAAPSWPKAPDHQNDLESFRYPSGRPSLRACLSSPLIKRSVNGSVNRPVNRSVNRPLNGCLLPFRHPSGILPVSFRRAGKNACP